MGEALVPYLEMKIHHLATYSQIDYVNIQAEYPHYWGETHRSRKEKNDKLFNYKRPRAVLNQGLLNVYCYPGKNYLKHMASVYASYGALKGLGYKVSFESIEAEVQERAIEASNIADIPQAEIAILGYVEELCDLTPEKNFQGEGDFQWVMCEINGQKVCLIGCKFCYWGDTVSYIIENLAKKGYEQCFYFAKLGGMQEEHTPNQYLATGNNTLVEGKTYTWDNVFAESAQQYDWIKNGKHICSPSVISEDKAWLNQYADYDFVDSEIGYMAKACEELGLRFSYLHIITNNLTDEYCPENLSNERERDILIKRVNLFRKLKTILRDVF